MTYFDLHADTLNRMWRQHQDLEGELDFENNDLHIDLTKLKSACNGLQTLALWSTVPNPNEPPVPDNFKTARNHLESQWEYTTSLFEKYGNQIGLIHSIHDIKEMVAVGKQPLLLSIEDIGPLGARAGSVGGNALDRVITQEIELFYKRGVRMMSPTWNYENGLAGPSGTTLGLKPSGFSALELMSSLGIAFDVSHLSDKGTEDALAHMKQLGSFRKPILASHSNARAICNHPRNLPDHLIKGIANSGGVIGLNFFSLFVGDDSLCEGLVKHIRHLEGVGGLDSIALGTDFDGMPLKDSLILHAGHMPRFVAHLEAARFTPRQIEAICYKNAERALTDIIG